MIKVKTDLPNYILTLQAMQKKYNDIAVELEMKDIPKASSNDEAEIAYLKVTLELVSAQPTAEPKIIVPNNAPKKIIVAR